jgi:hypothetical protein
MGIPYCYLLLKKENIPQPPTNPLPPQENNVSRNFLFVNYEKKE